MHDVNVTVTRKEPTRHIEARPLRLLTPANSNLRPADAGVATSSAVDPGPFNVTPESDQYIMLFVTVLVIVAAITAEVVVLAPKIVKGIELLSLFSL